MFFKRLRILAFKPCIVTSLLIVARLTCTVVGVLTQGGLVTSDSNYINAGDPCCHNCVTNNKLVDGKWPSKGFNQSNHCCTHTNPATNFTWININMGAQTVVQTIFLINREDNNNCCSARIIGADFYVGDQSIPNQNTPCGAFPQSSGTFSCGGKIGQYLGLYLPRKDYMNISQVRAYAYVANGFTDFQYLTSTLSNCGASTSNLVFLNASFLNAYCKMPALGAMAYYNIVYPTQRFIHAVTLAGNANADFSESRNWFLTVGAKTGLDIKLNTVYGQYLVYDFDRQGKEMKVGVYATSVGVYRQDGQALSFRWIAIFTTASDCSGPFDWSGSKPSWRIPLNKTAQTITGLLVAKIDDCAVFHSKLVLVDGSALPSIMTYNVYTQLLTVNIAATQTPVSYTVNACANLNDKVTTAKSECKPIAIEIFYATSIGWGTANFYYEMEQLGQQVVFDFPTTIWTPADANTIISYSVVGAPSFLSFQTTSNPVQGVINTSATTGTFTYQVIVQDSISGLTTTLNATLFVFNCMPTGFLLSPGSLTVRISGPGLTSAWSYTPLYSACGNYSISFDPSFAYLLTVSGQNIIAQAPQTALGTFNPVITLKRDSNPTYSTTATLSVTILAPLMTSLSFNLAAPATSFYYESELAGIQVVFDFPVIDWAPIDAEKSISFSIVGAPSFLTIQQSGTLVQGIISATAIPGTSSFQVIVTDSVSNLSAVLNATLFTYDCMPTGFLLSPSSMTVRISGPGLTSAWNYTPLYSACGNYSISFDASFAYLLTVSGQNIIAQAPQTALGDFNPVITLSRDSNAVYSTTATLAVTILAPLMTSLSFNLAAPATSFKFEIELTSNQMFFDFPAIVWAPIDAEKVISFELIGAPGFLTLKQTDTKVQGVLTSAITGTFNYQLKVTDSVSALTALLEASLFIYSCEPIGFALTPSSVSVSILGKSEALTWSMSQNYQACGSYSVTIEQAFASVISVNGQQLTAQALATASSGTFTPIITLKRDANPTQQVTGSLALAITSCMVTQLSFSKQPTSQVTIDLATYTDPITLPFDTKQTPQCNNEVAFALVPSSLTFLSLSTSSTSGGQVQVKETKVAAETTYAVTVRAFVNGKTAETNFSVIVKPKPPPAAQPASDSGSSQQTQEHAQITEAPTQQPTQNLTPQQQQEAINQQAFDWRAAFERQKTGQNQTSESQFKFVPVPPNPYFKELRADGRVFIGFNSEINTVPNLQMINNGTIFLDDFGRELAISTVKNVKKKSVPVLQVEILPSLESKAEDLTFRWNVTHQDAKMLQVQLYFDYPLNVSASPIADLLRVTFNDPILFTGTNGLVMDTQAKVIERHVPQQVQLGSTEAAVLSAFSSSADGAKGMVIGNFVANVSMSASLNQLWSMINTQQLIVLMPLFKVQMPASAKVFFNQLFKIASFNLIDIDPYINKMLSLNETEPFNPNFDSLGFNSMYFLNNMNSLLLGFILYFLLIILLAILDLFQIKRLISLSEKLRHMLFYNFILSMLTESYAMIAVCCMIGLNKLSFKLELSGEMVQTVCCLFALLVIIVYPPLVFWILKHSWNRVDFDRVQEKYEPLFEDLRTSIGPLALTHPMYFLFRRLLMAVNVVFFNEHLIFQVLLKDFTIIAGVIITGFIQYDSQAKRNNELINETVVMCVLYCMICFSPFVPDIEAKQVMGYFCCFLVSLHLAFNLYLILGSSTRGLILKGKLWLARRRLSKQRKLNKIRVEARIHSRKLAQANTDYLESEKPLSLESDASQSDSALEVIEEEGSSSYNSEIASALDSEVLEQQQKLMIQQELRQLEQCVESYFLDYDQKMKAIQANNRMSDDHVRADFEEIKTDKPTNHWDHETSLFAFRKGYKIEKDDPGLFELDFSQKQMNQKERQQNNRSDQPLLAAGDHGLSNSRVTASLAKNTTQYDVKQEMNEIDYILEEAEKRWTKTFDDQNLASLRSPTSYLVSQRQVAEDASRLSAIDDDDGLDGLLKNANKEEKRAIQELISFQKRRT